MSWADKIAAAKEGVERACVMLEQASHKGSKVKACSLIEDAIQESEAVTDVEDLLNLYGLAYSLDGLQECAVRFAKDLADTTTRARYFQIAW